MSDLYLRYVGFIPACVENMLDWYEKTMSALSRLKEVINITFVYFWLWALSALWESLLPGFIL